MTAGRWYLGLLRHGLLLRCLVALVMAGHVPVVVASSSPIVPAMADTSGFVARFVADRSNVAIIELTGNYDRDDAGGQFNVAPRVTIAREFLRTHADSYDMLAVFTAFPIATGDAVAFHHAVQNRVQGIGRPLFDNTASYGSAGKLQGFIDMAALAKYQTDSLNVDFDWVLQVFAHEFMHQFGAFVKYRKPDGSISASLIGYQDAHWSYLLNSDASTLLGSRWQDNGNGTFTATAIRDIYSPLDLYLAGFYGADEVPPFFLIEAPAVDPNRLPELGATVSGVRRDIRVEDIIAAEGARIPDAVAAQRDFRIAFIYVVRPGQTVTPEELAAIGSVRREIATRFSALTHGRANANVYAEPAQAERVGAPLSPLPDALPPASSMSLTSGLVWLKSRQQADGSWRDAAATAGRDASSALNVIATLEPGFSGLTTGLAWLGGAAAGNTDFLARALRTQAVAQRIVLPAASAAPLLSLQNSDGGWPLGLGYASDPLDTALALQALQATAVASGAASDQAIRYLLAQQNSDGGWGAVASGASRVTATALVLGALRTSSVAGDARQRGIAFLASRQNADGGFGDGANSVHDSAHALQALIALNATGNIAAAKAIQFLGTAQRADGSWDGSVYATALALDALARANAMNWAIAAFSATPGSTSDGQHVRLSVTVQNTGNQPAPAGKLRLYDGDPAAGGTVIGTDVDVPLLAPGAQATVLATWSTFNKAGAHTLYAVVDPQGSQSELSLADNRASLDYTVTPPGTAVDLLLADADLSVTPARPSEIPAALTVSALLTNAGQSAANGVRVVIREGDIGGNLAGETTIDVPARSTVVVSFPVTLAKAGTTTYLVQVDPDGLIVESDKGNNVAQVSVATGAAIDLEVLASDLSADKTSARVGDDLTFTVRLRNRGSSDANAVIVRYSMLDGSSEAAILANSLQLAAGQSVTQTIPWRADRGGALNFKAVLDPDGLVEESNEANNQALLPVTVIVADGPNLAVSYKDFSATPNPALEGSPVRLQIALRNTGNQPVANAELTFYLGDPANGGVAIAAPQVVANLAAGASQTLALDWPVPDTGDKMFFAVADPAGKVANEFTREDNRAFITVPVRSLPDLAVASGDLTLVPLLPRPADAVTLTVKVSNLGQQPALNVLVRLYDGDPAAGGLQIGGDQVVASLPEQSSAQVSFAWQFAADNNAHVLHVVVDPLVTVAERNRANNRASLPVTAQSGDFSVSNRYFSPDGDGVKDTTEFAFRLKSASMVAVQVMGSNNAVVRRHQEAAWSSVAAGQWVWDGRNDRGSLVRDDEYRLQLIDGSGGLLGEARVIVDTNRASLLDAVGTADALHTNLSCLIPQSVGFDLEAESYWRTGEPRSPDMTGLADGSAYFFLINSSWNADDLPPGVYRVNEWGADLRQIVAVAEADQSKYTYSELKVSADGSRVALIKYVYGVGYQLWVAGADGANLRRVDLGAVIPNTLIGFSASGEEVYFRDNAWNWQAVTLGSPAFVRSLGSLYMARLSPDGRKVVGIRNDVMNGRVAITDLVSGTYAPLAGQDELGMGDESRWAPDSSRVAMLSSNHGGTGRSLTVFDATGVLIYRQDNLAAATALSWSEDSADLYLATEENCDDGGYSCWRGVVLRLRLATGEWSELYGVDYAYPSDYACDCSQHGGYLNHVVVPGRDQTLVNVHLGRDPNSDYVGEGGYDRSIDLTAIVENAPPNVQKAFAWPKSGGPTDRSVFAQYGRALYYGMPWRPESGGACNDHQGADDWWVFRTLQNLTADLRVARTAAGTMLRLTGTAADRNLSRYVLEYSTAADPATWLPVIPAATDPVVDGLLAEWVPPAPGIYFIRLTVEDLAGNRRRVIKRVGWGADALIADVYRSPQYVSPNGDAVQDVMLLHYRVMEPVNLEFAIYNTTGDRIRTLTRNHPAIGVEVNLEWDGRDDKGQLVPDGEYRLKVLEYEFLVIIDSTAPPPVAPAINVLSLSNPGVCEYDSDHYGACIHPILAWQTSDPNFSLAAFDVGLAADPASWQRVVESRDAVGQVTPADPTFADFVLKQQRLTLRDRAGNATVQLAPSLPEQLTLIGFSTVMAEGGEEALSHFKMVEDPIRKGEWHPADEIIQYEPGHGLLLQLMESVKSPLVHAVIEYQYAGPSKRTPSPPTDKWLDVPLTDFYESNQSMGNFEGLADDYRIGPAFDADAVVVTPPDHVFLTRWGLQELGAEGVYWFRVRTLAQDGQVFHSQAYLIEKKSILKIIFGDPMLPTVVSQSGMVVWAYEELGRLVNSIDLEVKSTSDPYFATPRVLATVPGAADLRGLETFSVLDSSRYLACTPYAIRLVAHMADGDTVFTQWDTIDYCEKIKVGVVPVRVSGCGDTPVGKLQVGLALGWEEGDPAIQQLVFGRKRDDGSDDILFNVVDPRYGQIYPFELDMTGVPDGIYSYFARTTDIDGQQRQILVPIVSDHVPAVPRITYPAPDQKVCGRPLQLADGSTVSAVFVEGEIMDAGGFDYLIDFGMGKEPRTWNTAECLDRSNHYPIPLAGAVYFDPDSYICPTSHLAGKRIAGVFDYPLRGITGEVSVRLRAYDWGGYQVCQQASFTIDAQVEADGFVLDRRLFSPGTGSELSDVTVTYEAGESLVVAAEVYAHSALQFNERGVLTGFTASPVRTLAQHLQVAPGRDGYTWDGKVDSGHFAADGDYAIVLTLQDGCETKLVRYFEVEVDRTPPAVRIGYPKATDQLLQLVEIIGAATDKNFGAYTLEIGEGADPQGWLPLGGAAQEMDSELLGRWNTYGLAGNFTLRLSANDRAGNASETRVTLDLQARVDLLAYFDAQPALFSPNGDGRLDTAALRFGNSTPAYVTLSIFDGDLPVRTLIDNRAYGTTSASVAWDGNDGVGVPVAEKNYRATLEVVSQANANVRQTENLTLTVDRTPPAIELTHPAGAFVRGIHGVRGSIRDPHMASYAMSLTGINPSSAAVSLDSGSDERVGYRFADLSGYADGLYQLRVTAEDRAENRSDFLTQFEIDNTPPKVTLTAPAGGLVVGVKGSPLGIAGSIDERNLKLFSLNLGQGPPPYGTVLASGDQLPLANPIHALNVGSLADGPYVIQLAAEDKAGWTAQATTAIIVDNTPPIAVIRLPADGAMIRAAIDVVGTATDANFSQYILETAPGPKSQASRWTQFATGSSAVADGVLGRLNGLPADGVHSIRLLVTDKAGNSASALVQLTIDTTPPPPPLNLTAKVQNRQDARLDWTASSVADLAGYAVYRDGKRITQDLVPAPTYLDVGLAEGKYSYHVTAVDQAGNESQGSNVVEVTISLSVPVAVIQSPAKNGLVSGLVDIKGTAYSPRDFKEYRLAIGNGAVPTDFITLRSSPVAIQGDLLAQWNTIGLAESSVHTIRLEAEDIYGNIATDTATVTVDNLPPAKPTLHAVANGNDVTLTWPANSEPDMDGYLLFRDGHLVNATGPVVGSLKPYLIHDLTYLDEDVADGTRVYTLIAVDLAGNESEPSDPAEVLIDTRPPHAVIVQPADGAFVDRATYVLATTPDTDVATVRFQYKPAAASDWIDIEPLSIKAPYSVTWNPQGLPYGSYQLRPIATDIAGHIDPNPAAIAVTYKVLDRPSAPMALKAHVTGGDVTLTWTASDSPATIGYILVRSDEAGGETTLNDTPVDALTYVDPDVADGKYTYKVMATDDFGNLSDPAGPAPALVFTPTLRQPYTPTAAATTTLTGHGEPALATAIIRTVAGVPTTLATVAADAQGGFTAVDVALIQGDNRFSVIQRDLEDNTSKPGLVHVVAGTPPAAPAGVSGSASGLDVSLSWLANQEADLDGYFVLIDDEARTALAIISGATASSNPGIANYGVDGNRNSDWYSSDAVSTEQPVSFEVTLAETAMVSAIDVTWARYDDWYSGAADFDVEGWDGEVWVPLAAVRGNTEPISEVRLTKPYRTDRIRLQLYALRDTGWNMTISELAVRRLETTSDTSTSFKASDGQHAFAVSAFNTLGLVGAPAVVPIGVGDVTPPDVVVLQGEVQGADNHLSWTASVSPDVVAYELSRDDVYWTAHADLANLAEIDAGKLNGTYRYRVVAVDDKGNRSQPSNEVSLTVALPPPAPVIELTVTVPPVGSTLDLAWALPANSEEPAAYRVLRSQQAGGPYEALTTTDPIVARSYRDTGLSNGVRYYYRVHGVDAIGNTGAQSNEASGVPIDSEAPSIPVLVYPAVPGVSATVDTGYVPVMGFAEPGATVALRVNGTSAGTVTAIADDRVTDIWASGETSSLSPDGNRVAIGTYGQLQILRIVSNGAGDQVEPVQTLSYDLAGSLLWSPRGEHLAFVDETYEPLTDSYLRTLRYWTVADGQVRTLAAVVPTSALAVSWSSVGKRLIVGGIANDGSNRAGLWQLDLATGSLAQLVDSGAATIDWVAASPDGNHVAYTRDGQLEVLDLGTRNPTVIDALDGAGWPTWSYDGQSLLYESYAGGLIRIMRYDIGAIGPSVITDGSTYTTMPVWSPDGTRIAYAGERNVILNLLSGEETEFGPAEPFALEWRQSGDILYSASYGHLVRLRPAGHFVVPSVRLQVGENTLVARASDADGNQSADSAAAQVIYSTANRPDLSVTLADIAVLPSLPNLSDQVRISVTVNNIGQFEAAASDVALVLLDAAGTQQTLIDAPVAGLAAGASQTVSVDWSPAATGRYRLVATADRSNRVAEVREDNNVALRQFQVVDAATQILSVATDAADYGASQAVEIAATVTNGGGAFTGSLAMAVEDAQGYIVATLPALPITGLAYGETLAPKFPWNTGATLAGGYRAHGRLLDAEGALVTEASAAFTITTPLVVNAGVTTDSAEYGANAPVALLGTISAGASTQGRAATARFRIVSPTGATVFEESQAITLGAYLNPVSAWNTVANVPGSYTVVLEVVSAGATVATASSTFRITPSTLDNVTLAGRLTLSRSRLQPSEILVVDATVENRGNVGIAHLPVVIRVVDPVSGGTLARQDATVELTAGGSVDLHAEFPATGWPLRALAVLLEADRSAAAVVPSANGAAPQLLDQESISLFATALPAATIAVPANNAYLKVAGTMLANAEAAQGNIVGGEYRVGGGAWVAVAGGGVPNQAYSIALPALVDGPYSLYFRGTDQFGNVSAAAQVDVIIDSVPPAIVIGGVADGQGYAPGIAPTIVVSDLHLATTRITLDGAPFVSGTAVTGIGGHVLEVYADDLAGNVSATQVLFAVATVESPVVTAAIIAPLNHSYLKSAGTLRGTAAAMPGPVASTEYRIDGGNWVALVGGATPDGQYAVTLPAVVDGPHSFQFRAIDQGGVISPVAQVAVIIDSVPPAIVITGVANGQRHAPGVVPTISVTDLHLATTRMTLDGAEYRSGSAISELGTHELEVYADDLAGNSSLVRISFVLAPAVPNDLTPVAVPANHLPWPLWPLAAFLSWLALRPLRAQLKSDRR